MQHITEVAKTAGVDAKYLEQYGNYKAKVDYNILNETPRALRQAGSGHAINPTPAGEGKTTTTRRSGLRHERSWARNVLVALREAPWDRVLRASRARWPAAFMLRSWSYGGHQPPLHRRLHAIGAANNLLAAHAG